VDIIQENNTILQLALDDTANLAGVSTSK